MDMRLPLHYYGHTVRVIFFTGGLLMVVSYPFFSSYIGLPIPLSIIGCIILAIFAGLMNPKQKMVIVFNTVISIAAFGVFEYITVLTYSKLPSTDPLYVAFFWVNLALSIFFFIAAYLSTKTLRGVLLEDKNYI